MIATRLIHAHGRMLGYAKVHRTLGRRGEAAAYLQLAWNIRRALAVHLRFKRCFGAHYESALAGQHRRSGPPAV